MFFHLIQSLSCIIKHPGFAIPMYQNIENVRIHRYTILKLYKHRLSMLNTTLFNQCIHQYIQSFHVLPYTKLFHSPKCLNRIFISASSGKAPHDLSHCNQRNKPF
uniref:Pentatricopeptide repeat-containing protein At3g22670-like n=1 Tax=Rhizophora mucronata TaxID=61149 RepID=A0A2P2QLT6_RHIMU